MFDDCAEDLDWDDLEPIPFEEANRIIAALGSLMTSSSHPSVAAILEEACCELAALIPDDEEDDSEAA